MKEAKLAPWLRYRVVVGSFAEPLQEVPGLVGRR